MASRPLLLFAVALALAFGAGIVSATPVLRFASLVTNGSDVRCATKDVCVGDRAAAAGHLVSMDDTGGLSAVYCGSSGAQIIFITHLLQGQHCESADYTLEFRSQTTRTLVSIRDNTITKIAKGPLHAFDP